MVEFRNGELFLFNNKVNRHAEMPWLFSATDMHKACRGPIQKSAQKKGKDPEQYFESKKPAQWLRFNLLNDEERIAKVAGRLREKIKEYGPGMGLVELDKKSKVSALTLLSTLTDLESIVYQKRGGAKGTAGTYVSLHVLIAYSSFLSLELKDAIVDLITSVISGEVETVTEQVEKARATAKGSKELEQCKEAGIILQEACAEKKLRNVIKVQEGINEGILGMPGEKYRKLNGLPKPLNDNLSLGQIHQKLHANLFAADSIKEDSRAVIPAVESKVFGLRAGLRAKIVCADADLRKLLDQRVAAEEKLYLSKIAQANARSTVKKIR
jgi:hypothetical protein